MKTIETGGIKYIELIPYGADEWYYGISYEHGDLYEADEFIRGAEENGHEVTVYNMIRKNIKPCLGYGTPSMTSGSIYPQKAYELGKSI